MDRLSIIELQRWGFLGWGSPRKPEKFLCTNKQVPILSTASEKGLAGF